MSMIYKIDVMTSLQDHDYSTYRIRKEKLLSEGALTSIRNKKPISWSNIEMLCKLLSCQPGDLLEYVSDDAESDTENPAEDLN